MDGTCGVSSCLRQCSQTGNLSTDRYVAGGLLTWLLLAASYLTDIFPSSGYHLTSVCRVASFAYYPVFIYLCNQDDFSIQSEISGPWSLTTLLIFYGEDRVGYSQRDWKLQPLSKVFFKYIFQTACINQAASRLTVQPAAELICIYGKLQLDTLASQNDKVFTS